MYTLYGISNCNTVKKAINHLDGQNVAYEFVNFKKCPPKKIDIKRWKEAFGDWPVNKRGPTFRKIKDNFERANSTTKYTILMENTSAIKRPILMKDDNVIAFGYDEEVYSKLK